MLPAFLKELRGDRHVSEVAAALGVKTATVYHWESGERNPPPEQLAKLLTVYGASDEQLSRALRLRAGITVGDLQSDEAA